LKVLFSFPIPRRGDTCHFFEYLVNKKGTRLSSAACWFPELMLYTARLPLAAKVSHRTCPNQKRAGSAKRFSATPSSVRMKEQGENGSVSAFFSFSSISMLIQVLVGFRSALYFFPRCHRLLCLFSGLSIPIRDLQLIVRLRFHEPVGIAVGERKRTSRDFSRYCFTRSYMYCGIKSFPVTPGGQYVSRIFW
jgi:hypothetical protein